MEIWAENSGLLQVPGYSLDMIGWDFPVAFQKQINVYHMHGYASVCILPEGFTPKCQVEEIATQYDNFTIRNIQRMMMTICLFLIMPGAICMYIHVFQMGQILLKSL